MKTIKCPMNMGMISSRLPKPQYSPMKENNAQMNNFVRTPDKKQFKLKLRKSVTGPAEQIAVPVKQLLPTISEDPDMRESESTELSEQQHLSHQRRIEKLRGLNSRASNDCLTAIYESVNRVDRITKQYDQVSPSQQSASKRHSYDYQGLNLKGE